MRVKNEGEDEGEGEGVVSGLHPDGDLERVNLNP